MIGAPNPDHGARLRLAGIRTSKRRVPRLTREHGLLAPGRVGRPHGPKAHDGTIRTARVDLTWATDLTSTLTGEGQAAIFVTVDHGSTECLGIHAARQANRFEALEPLRQGVRACFGAFAEGIAGGLRVRHDHGSQFVAHDYQRELSFLGIESSPAFVREPEGNGCVERLIRTLKRRRGATPMPHGRRNGEITNLGYPVIGTPSLPVDHEREGAGLDDPVAYLCRRRRPAGEALGGVENGETLL